MAQAAGKRRTKIPPLPSGFIYDLPSLTRPPHSASTSPENPSPSHTVATPRVSPSVQTPPGNSAEFQLQPPDRETTDRAASFRAGGSITSSRFGLYNQYQATITGHRSIVRFNGKSQRSMSHSACHARNLKISTAEFVYGYLDIYTSTSPVYQPLMMQHLMSLMRLASKFDWDAVLSSTQPFWIVLSLVSLHGVTISVRLSASISRSPTASSRPSQAQPTPKAPNPTTIVLVTIARNGIVQGHVPILPTNKVWNTSAPTASSRPHHRFLSDSTTSFTTNSLALPTLALSPTSTLSPPTVCSPLPASTSPVSVSPSNLTGQLSLSSNHSYAAVIRHILCLKLPLPNDFGTRISVPSKLNIPVLKSYLKHYPDSVIIDFLAFGWPINCHFVNFPVSRPPNYSSAIHFPDEIDSFLLTELQHTATAGPFTCNTFPVPL